MKIYIVLLGLILMLPVFPGIYAQQISGNAGYSLFYSDNPYRLNDGKEEFVSTYQAMLEYQPKPGLPSFSYSFGLNDFKNYTDRSFNLHSFNAAYAFQFLDTTNDENVSLNAFYAIKSNTSGDGTYKYNSFGLSGEGSFFLSDNLMLTAGYGFSSRNYPSLYDLDYKDNNLFTRISAFFETKTSLHFEAALGNRGYSINQQTYITTSPMGGPMGNKMGGQTIIRNNLLSTNVTQLRSTFKASQSLTDKAGMNMFYRLNNHLGQGNGISLTEFMYSDDEDLWDDPYSFEGNDFGTGLTWVLPYEMTLRLTGEYSGRRYKENLADTVFFKQRLDNRTEFWLGITKEFSEGLPLARSLMLDLEFMHIINNSNEKYFTYKNNLLLLKMAVGF
ncbi:MAG: hypothetical protein ACM3Q2_16735 [Syntrophothermus sp.]